MPVFQQQAPTTPYSSNGWMLNPSVDMGSGGITGQASPSPGGFLNQPMAVWVGALVLLLVIKVASEKESSPISPAHYHVGGFNLGTQFLSWFVTLFLVKVAVLKWFPNSSAAAALKFVSG